jgi:hypothetical protein
MYEYCFGLEANQPVFVSDAPFRLPDRLQFPQGITKIRVTLLKTFPELVNVYADDMQFVMPD